jgi:hypothetical protein
MGGRDHIGYKLVEITTVRLAGGRLDGKESKYHDGGPRVYQYPVHSFLLIEPGGDPNT